MSARRVLRWTRIRSFQLLSRGNVMRRIVAIVALTVSLTGCPFSNPAVIRQPVEVTRYVYVGIDKALTAPCPVAMPRNNGGKELLRVSRERRQALEGCANAQLKAISRVQGTPVEPVKP